MTELVEAKPTVTDFSKFRGAQRLAQVQRLHELLDKHVSAADAKLDDVIFVNIVVGRYLAGLPGAEVTGTP